MIKTDIGKDVLKCVLSGAFVLDYIERTKDIGNCCDCLGEDLCNKHKTYKLRLVEVSSNLKIMSSIAESAKQFAISEAKAGKVEETFDLIFSSIFSAGVEALSRDLFDGPSDMLGFITADSK